MGQNAAVDVAPDGKRLAAILPVGAEPEKKPLTELIVLLSSSTK